MITPNQASNLYHPQLVHLNGTSEIVWPMDYFFQATFFFLQGTTFEGVQNIIQLIKDLKLMIKLLLVWLPNICIVLTMSLLHGLLNCSSVSEKL